MNSDSTQAVGVGIIGAGVISGQYLENLARMPGLRVLWVADADPARARARAEQFGVPSHGTVEQLLADPRVVVVVNLTVPQLHVEVALRAVAAGKHVWGEKPFSLDRESGLKLLEAAEKAGVRVASAPDTILGQASQTARRVVESGAIGTPLTGLAIFQTAGPESWHPSPQFLYAKGGGPLFDVGPYYLSNLFQIFGPVDSVAATHSTALSRRIIGSGPKAGTDFPVEVPTQVAALLRFEGGGSAQTIFSFDSAKTRAGIVEITGTSGNRGIPRSERLRVERRGVATGDGRARSHRVTAVHLVAGDWCRRTRGGHSRRQARAGERAHGISPR